MKLLVTGAKGFVGKNLVTALECIQDGRDRSHTFKNLKEPSELVIFSYDIDSTEEELEQYTKEADFVFHLAGVNRPKNPEDFKKGNAGFTEQLLFLLKKHGNNCPVLLASSIQATLAGRYADSEYGRSKLLGEEILFEYGRETGAKVYIYRFPNLFGKWCRPNYNSAVATFCYNIANDLPIQINDRKTMLELLYIDDLIENFFHVLNGEVDRCEYQGLETIPEKDGRYCFVPVTFFVTLGEIADLLEQFKEQPENLFMPEIAEDSFAKRLYTTYLSYLPKEKICFPLKMNTDARGSFTELLKTTQCGQFSVNISKPGITKGEHWHHSKWEFFIVVSGEALIQERKVGTEEVLEFRVSGEKIEAVHMLPGYAHNIINLSETKDLVTLMWANEVFDPVHPDTFFEKVEK